MTREPFTHVHFIGIGGIGMSGLAQILLAMGYRVSGSDMKASSITERLRQAGADVRIGHHAAHIDGADLVVYSSAVRVDNPEYEAALASGVRLWKRARMLAELLRDRLSVVVAGAHGKTTTTSMIAAVLNHAGLCPTSIIGGELDEIGGNARLGSGNIVVAEGDESDGSFVCLRPTMAVVTNIDADHMDYYSDWDHLMREFARFLDGVAVDGRIFLSADCPRARTLGAGRPQAVTLFGLDATADYTAVNLEYGQNATHFDVIERGVPLRRFALRIPGVHAVRNSLAAIAVCRALGAPLDAIVEALARTNGPKRRFEWVGQRAGVTVIDDYAHHPTEIHATLSAFAQRFPGRRIGVFQPHRYTRTAKLLNEFGGVFSHLDAVVLTDVYAAGEAPIPGADGRALYERVRLHARHVVYVDTLDDASLCLLEMVRPGDALITMGAGDVWKVGRAVLEGLEQAAAAEGERSATA